jgi:signal transduction histidine kinase
MNASISSDTSAGSEFDAALARSMMRHPLEMFPLFRRWPQGFWRDLIYTAIWNTLFALILSLVWAAFDPGVPLARILKYNFVIAQCIGFTIQFSFFIVLKLVPISPRSSFVARAVYFSAIPMVGVYVGYWISSVVLGWSDLQAMLLTARGALGIALISVVLSSIVFAILLPRERAARAQLLVAQEQARVAAAEREATIARMQLLEAQVEPHFLYNTMAHVVSLIDAEPAAAKRMLERLIVLLRSTAGATVGGGTLQAQADHLRAYLDILALRMGARLGWTIDIPPEFAALPMPPMLLQPVVENAIKHGLEPKVEGGRVAIAARREEGRLLLTVSDTGLGFRERRAGDSTGLGLANLRARLATLYGATAALTIEDNAPAGTRVTIALPMPAATQ